VALRGFASGHLGLKLPPFWLPVSLTSFEMEDFMDEESRYTMQESIWDCGCFIGCPLPHVHDSIAMVICLLINCGVQGFLLYIVGSSMMGTEYTADYTQKMLIWRAYYGQVYEYADKNLKASLTTLICADSTLTMQGGKQSDNYTEAHEYLESNGPMLCLLAMFLWLMTVQKEAKQIYFLGSAVLNLTGGGKATYFHVEESSISFEIKSMSRARAVLIFCLVIIPRAVRYIMLGIIGIRYLSVTMGLENLLLNAMALEVVISVDELVFQTFCSLEVDTLIRRTEPLSKGSNC